MAQTLYNGVSNRSRGWKSRRSTGGRDSSTGGGVDDPMSLQNDIKRWYGRARTSHVWDSLRRDPELWFSNGNCFVYLHARDPADRHDPSFKVPVSTLLAAQCHPLLEMFGAHETSDQQLAVPEAAEASSSTSPPSPSSPPRPSLDYWGRAHLLDRVDLYIPPPPNADDDEVLCFYLTTRNFFAWVFGRPVVGTSLGRAMIGLFDYMRDFRLASADNVVDLVSYAQEQHYLDMVNQCDYALAALQLAEKVQHRDLYIDAFTQCVGMYNILYESPEYEHISSVSRRLIRRGRLDMDLRLSAAACRLSSFLEEDLSEAFLGLPGPARTHLDRFRAYLQSFYAARLGYYPPRSIDPRVTIFEPSIYKSMAADFEALYEYLVDKSFTSFESSPVLAQGGVCVLQTVESFDDRLNFPTMEHPLPLLPEVSSPAAATTTGSGGTGSGNATKSGNGSGKRFRPAWLGGKGVDHWLLGRSDRPRPDLRLLSHAALLRATNMADSDLCQNDLVRAYRQFEESSVYTQLKADRADKISIVDARKVRWILIYSIHQTLRNFFTPPPREVQNVCSTSYHISVSTVGLPPWDDAVGAGPSRTTSLSRRLTVISRVSSSSHALSSIPPVPTTPDVFTRRNSYRDSSGYMMGEGGTPPITITTTTEGAQLERSREVFDAADAAAAASPAEMEAPQSPTTWDIQPDVDYIGMAERSMAASENASNLLSAPGRTRSLTRSLSRNAAFRRSLALFRSNNNNSTQPAHEATEYQQTMGGNSTEEPPSPALGKLGSPMRECLTPSPQPAQQQRPTSSSRGRKNPPYHEIVVQGYGNGTMAVHFTSPPSTTDTGKAAQTGAESGVDVDSAAAAANNASASRTLSTSSTNSNTSASSAGTAVSATSATTVASAATRATELSDASDAGTPHARFTQSPVDKKMATVATRRPSSAHGATAASMVAGATLRSRSPSRKAQGTTTRPLSRSGSVYSMPTTGSVATAYALPEAPSSSYFTSVPPVPPVPPIPDLAALQAVSLVPTVTPRLPSPSPSPSPAPSVPARKSARHRRFSVYGGGDEYAAVVPPSLLAGKKTMSHASGLHRIAEPVPPVPFIKPSLVHTSTMPAIPTMPDTRRMSSHGGGMMMRAATTLEQKRRSAPHLQMQSPSQLQPGYQQHYQRLDMVQKALMAVRETIEQHQMEQQQGQIAPTGSQHGNSNNIAGPRYSEMKPQRQQQPASRNYRHSSYAGYSYAASISPSVNANVQPEWEKFAVGLGGLTVLPTPEERR